MCIKIKHKFLKVGRLNIQTPIKAWDTYAIAFYSPKLCRSILSEYFYLKHIGSNCIFKLFMGIGINEWSPWGAITSNISIEVKFFVSIIIHISDIMLCIYYKFESYRE